MIFKQLFRKLVSRSKHLIFIDRYLYHYKWVRRVFIDVTDFEVNFFHRICVLCLSRPTFWDHFCLVWHTLNMWICFSIYVRWNSLVDGMQWSLVHMINFKWRYERLFLFARLCSQCAELCTLRHVQEKGILITLSGSSSSLYRLRWMNYTRAHIQYRS